MKKSILYRWIVVIVLVLAGIIGLVNAEGYSCSSDNDCKTNICSTGCVNNSFTTPQGVGCSYPPYMIPDYCKCDNNKCIGYKSCTDSDGGRNYYVKGEIDSILSDDVLYHSEDLCDGNNLTEFYCNETNALRETVVCEGGCSDGTCIKLEETNLTEIKNKGFKFVYWQCYDGTESESKEDSCKLSESWQKDANKFCDKKCNKDGSKCGVNSFSVSNECNTSEVINECNENNLGNNFCSDTKTSTYCGIESVNDNGEKTYSFKNLTCYNGYCKEGYCIGSDTEVLIEKDIGTAKYVLTMPYEENGMYIINYNDPIDNKLNLPIQVWLSLGDNIKSKQWCQGVLKLALQGDKIKTPEGWNSGDYIDIPPGKVLNIDGNEVYQTNVQPVVFWISYGKCVEILNNANQQVVKGYLKKYPSSCKDKTCLFEKEEPVERECIVNTNCCPVCGIDVPCPCYSKCINGKCIEAGSEKRNCEDKGGLCILSNEKCKEGYSISESSVEDCDAKSFICCIPNNIALPSSVLICKDSCPLEDKCYPFGYRKDGKYCSNRMKFIEQLKANAKCDNNFECSSNVCVGGECVSEGLIQKILDWFRKLFGSSEE